MSRLPEEKIEDARQERMRASFQTRVRALHKELLEKNSGLFTVAEIIFLSNVPYKTHQYQYTEDDERKLLTLKQKINAQTVKRQYTM